MMRLIAVVLAVASFAAGGSDVVVDERALADWLLGAAKGRVAADARRPSVRWARVQGSFYRNETNFAEHMIWIFKKSGCASAFAHRRSAPEAWYRWSDFCEKAASLLDGSPGSPRARGWAVVVDMEDARAGGVAATLPRGEGNEVVPQISNNRRVGAAEPIVLWPLAAELRMLACPREAQASALPWRDRSPRIDWLGAAHGSAPGTGLRFHRALGAVAGACFSSEDPESVDLGNTAGDVFGAYARVRVARAARAARRWSARVVDDRLPTPAACACANEAVGEAALFAPPRKVDKRGAKYALAVDGNDVATSLFEDLCSDRTLFAPPPVWENVLGFNLTAGVHYVEIASDFSDIDAKIAWCERDGAATCERIGRNSRPYVDALRRSLDGALTAILVALRRSTTEQAPL